ncbi:MAG TPA: NADH-quinone oxidoreductase subunit C [Candidatus Cloacimonetes bacterium]|nr:NADH-quinone oxidoreductase subunit C [Candidatus Cloacimonadota bacterium]
MKDLINRIKSKFKIEKVVEKRKDLIFFTIKKDNLPTIITHLRDYENYTHFVFLTAIDYLEKEIFQLTYLLHNYQTHTDLGIRVEIDRKNPEMISIHHLWEQVGTYQRELKEMFGINFPGSPRIDESFILERWQEIPPLRRDFDSREYSEKTYFPRKGRKSFDPKEYMKKKLYHGK